MTEIERVIMLMVVDRKWMDHIDAMDQLRQGIGIRSYGQQDPVRAYGAEGFEMFNEMNESIKVDVLKGLFNIQPAGAEIERERAAKEVSTNIQDEQTTVVKGKQVGRNDPCPCGSGLKYKNCCGRKQYGKVQRGRKGIVRTIPPKSKKKEVTLMVELDAMKTELQAYETPLAEVRDSL